MSSKSLRVLVIDDTRVYRTIISDTLAAIAGVEVVGTAANGEIALSKLAELAPDLLTLDVEMPVMDGLATLRKLRELKSKVLVVMVSAHTKQGAAVTMEALQLGAYDFITKPEEDDPRKSRELLESRFRPIINAILTQKILRQTISTMATGGASAALSAKPSAPPAPMQSILEERLPLDRVEIVAIGISTGGPNALAELLPRLPATLRVPIVIVQHMPKLFTGALADSLNAKCALRVVEALPGQILEPGYAYIAPGGKQMRVAPRPRHSGYWLEITDDPPENHCQPSVDYLFRSVASVFKGQALAIIMTGMGSDGVLGLRLLKRHGVHVIAQDQASCVVYGMPQEAVKAGVVDVVLPLSAIGDEILRRLR
jgi:two-component system chemotaxis response regulator CheB